MQTSLVKKCVAEFIGMKDAVVYFAGPLLGGGLAGLIYGRFLIKP